MYTKWTEHLPEPDKPLFHNQLRAAKPILERQSQIIKDELASTERSETDVKEYGAASWPYLQADKNGYKRALKFLLKLIDLDQQDQKKDKQ